MYDNVRADYRSPAHAPRRRSHSSGARRRGAAEKQRVRPLAVCVAVLAFAVAIHFVFPHFSRAVGDKVSTVFDYRTALAVLGEGISGERKLGAAVTEAWAAAFRAGDASTEVVAQPDTPLSPAPTAEEAAAEAFANAPPGGEAEAFAEDAPEDGVSSFAEAALAAFAESQYGYADYMMPAGVSYDMPALGISGQSPTDGVVSSGFGFRRHPVSGDVRFHYGTDIAAANGTPIVAFADGVVALTGDSATLGSYIIISHENSISTTYAHCGEVFFAPGETVRAGEKIATVSSTGNATDDCLHFELKVDGVCVNPEFYVQWA